MFVPTDPDDEEKTQFEFYWHHLGELIAASAIVGTLFLIELFRALAL